MVSRLTLRPLAVGGGCFSSRMCEQRGEWVRDIKMDDQACPSLKTSEPIAKFIFIDIYMDGFSLHWQSAPLRRTVNYRVTLVIRVPERIDSAHGQVNKRTNGVESRTSYCIRFTKNCRCTDSRGVAHD